jgi:tripartite-type tricarboxylate transporter receptor subunit TctC
MRRTRWIAPLLLVALAATGGSLSFAQGQYPTRDIEFIIPFAPGGPADAAARLIAPLIQAKLGQTIVLTNRPGGGGAVGAAHVAAARPDGYTVFATVNAPLSVAAATRSVPYKLDDFIALGQYMVDFQLVAVRSDAPWKTLDELMHHAKTNPGKLNYGSAGLGTISYFNMEMLKLATGADIVHVPFQGTGPVKNAILGKQVDVAASAAGAMLPLARSGDIRLLVTTARHRLADFPDVPTMVEKGYPDASLSTWAALFVPKGTPTAIVDKLAAALKEAAADPSLAAASQKVGMAVEYRDGEATRTQMEREFASVKRAAERLGIGKK